MFERFFVDVVLISEQNHGVRKCLAALAIIGVLALGIVGALAVVPHAHDKDYNHSRHETCPVYQFGLSNVHADLFHVDVILALFLFGFLIETQKSLSIFFSRSFAYLRAPPVVSSSS